jgi:fructosamine-3-kinase
MADLFGGFDSAFFAAYESVWPLREGSRVRRYVYQLYYLLVHVNLFGVGYAGQTLTTLRKVLEAK